VLIRHSPAAVSSYIVRYAIGYAEKARTIPMEQVRKPVGVIHCLISLRGRA